MCVCVYIYVYVHICPSRIYFHVHTAQQRKDRARTHPSTHARTRARNSHENSVRHTCTYTRHPVRYDTTVIRLNKKYMQRTNIFV